MKSRRVIALLVNGDPSPGEPVDPLSFEAIPASLSWSHDLRCGACFTPQWLREPLMSC
jgi:hypothetical protein